jgi:hypothetical protein
LVPFASVYIFYRLRKWTISWDLLILHPKISAMLLSLCCSVSFHNQLAGIHQCIYECSL